MKILMVCVGNICRSPLGEGILRDKIRKAGLNWQVESAGTNNAAHVGDAPHLLSQKVALMHNIDISGQCARAFVAADFDRFDLLYAMSKDVLADMKRIAGRKFKKEKADLLLNELFEGQNHSVPDPWYGDESGYHAAWEMIEKSCENIIQKYGHLKTA